MTQVTRQARDQDAAASCCRAPRPHEYSAVRALLEMRATNSYVARAIELLDSAEHGSTEYQVMLAVGDDNRPSGVGIFGLVAGARAAGVIHFLSDGDASVMDSLLVAMLERLQAMHARFAAAELADDPSLERVRSALAARDFREESRVPDLYREGVALTFLRRELETA